MPANHQNYKRGIQQILSHSPQKEPSLPTCWCWTSSIQNCETINFCCLSHSVGGTLLWQPQQTNTHCHSISLHVHFLDSTPGILRQFPSCTFLCWEKGEKMVLKNGHFSQNGNMKVCPQIIQSVIYRPQMEPVKCMN